MSEDSLTFATSKTAEMALAAREEVFRYCTFESSSIEGGDFDGVFISCTFRDMEWYWGLFNLALFVDCKFERCTFRGSSFAGCRFIESTFSDCCFLADNLGATCSAPDTKLYGCSEQNCEGWNELFSNRAP